MRNPSDIFLFYIALALIGIFFLLLALPTLIHGPKKKSKK